MINNEKSLFGLPEPVKKVKTKSVKDILTKACSVKRAPSIRKSSNILDKVKEAEDLAIEKLSMYKDKYELITTKERLLEYLNSCPDDIITLDTETGAKTPQDDPKDALDFYKGQVVGICLHVKGQKACYVPIHHMNPITGELIENQISKADVVEVLSKFLDKKWIYHNAVFDIRFMLHTFGIRLDYCFYWDTLNVGHCINENEIHKLKELHLKYCPDPTVNETEAIEFTDLFKGLNFAFIKPEIGMLYAAGDPLKTRDLYEWQKNYLEQPGRERLNWVAKNIEIPVIPVCIRMEEEGVPIDKVYLESLKDTYNKKLEGILDRVYKAIDEHKDEINDYKAKQKPGYDKLSDPINLSSPKQLSILFYDIFKLKQLSKNKTDGEALLKLARQYQNYAEIFKNLVKYKEVSKLVSAFINNIDKYIQSDGRVHPRWNPSKAVTSRMSCDSPNLQQIPSHEKAIRKMYSAGLNRYLIGSDYSKQEVFLAVEACLDPKLLEVFHNNLDIYSKLASDIFEVPYEDCLEFYLDKDGNKTKETNAAGKNRRSIAKSIWLGITYGLGATTFADNINEAKAKENDKKLEKGEKLTKEDLKQMTVPEAQKILNKINTTYPTLVKWKSDLINNCRKNGYVETLWGRRRNLPMISAPKYEFDLIKDELTGKRVCPSCFEENPLDWDSDADTKEYTIKDVPKNIIQKYLNELNTKYVSRQKFSALQKEAKEKDKLDIIDNSGYIADAERQCVNSCIQGSAANLTKLALIAIDNDPELKKLDFRLCLAVHDEILGTAPCENALEAGRRVAQIMIDAGKGVVNHLKIKTDISISEKWYGDEIGMELLLARLYKDNIVKLSDWNEEKQQYYTLHKNPGDIITLELGADILASSKPIKSDEDIMTFVHSPEFAKYVKIQD